MCISTVAAVSIVIERVVVGGVWGRTRLTCPVVQVLAGQVEVELLQLKGLVGNRQGAPLSDDLDGLEDGEDAVDHVDGRLAGAGGAHPVGRGLECRPVEWPLMCMSVG
jgi:hypothetical protein